MDSFKKFSFKTQLLQYYEEDEEGTITYTEIQDGQRVEMGGIITAMAKKTTKGGASMCIITLEDVYGGIECVFFPKAYEKYRSLIRAEAIVAVSGRMQMHFRRCKGDHQGVLHPPAPRDCKTYSGLQR